MAVSDLSIAALTAALEHERNADNLPTLTAPPEPGQLPEVADDDVLVAASLERKRAWANHFAALAYTIDFYRDVWFEDEEALGELVDEMIEDHPEALRSALVALVICLAGTDWRPPAVIAADSGDDLMGPVPAVRVPYSPPVDGEAS